MKKLLKKIIDYLWRWSNTNLSDSMHCTFCGKEGMHMMINKKKERHHVCSNCQSIYNHKYKSSYWGGLGYL